MVPNNFLQQKQTNLTISQLYTTKRNIKEIILHCSATPEGKDIKAVTIDKWHRAKGWNGIGYQFYIDLDGTIEVGRNINVAGAHATNHNSISIGICYAGGCAKDGKTPKDTRTPQQKLSLYELVHDLLLLYPNVKVMCHNQVAKKACPSFKIEDFQKEYQLWLRTLNLSDKYSIK